MNNSAVTVCPHCDTPNRVPLDRLEGGGTCGTCKKPLFIGKPFDLNEANFDRHIGRSQLPIVVDFWAPWCGPCRMMAPAYAQAAQELEPWFRLAKVNTETAQGLAARFNIRSIPTLILFRDGHEIARHSGAMDTANLKRWIQASR